MENPTLSFFLYKSSLKIKEDSFVASAKSVKQDSSLVMSSLDVDTLFTNIPLDETINVCTNTVYIEQDVI